MFYSSIFCFVFVVLKFAPQVCFSNFWVDAVVIARTRARKIFVRFPRPRIYVPYLPVYRVYQTLLAQCVDQPPRVSLRRRGCGKLLLMVIIFAMNQVQNFDHREENIPETKHTPPQGKDTQKKTNWRGRKSRKQ